MGATRECDLPARSMEDVDDGNDLTETVTFYVRSPVGDGARGFVRLSVQTP